MPDNPNRSRNVVTFVRILAFTLKDKINTGYSIWEAILQKYKIVAEV